MPNNFLITEENPNLNDEQHDSKISANDIETTPERRFISTDERAKLYNSITKTDLNAAKEELSIATRRYINTSIDRLINAKGITQNLEMLARALKSSDALQTVLDELATKVSISDNNKNDETIKDLCNQISAINYLLEGVKKSGFSDWAAEEGDVNYIANKPTSLPACGGDADSIQGFDKEYLMINKSKYSYVIGLDSDFSNTYVNILLYTSDISELLMYIISQNLLPNGGALLLREGQYTIDQPLSFRLPDRTKELVLSGCGRNTVISSDNNTITVENCSLKDMYIQNTNVILRSYANINNVSFNNCNIILQDSIGVRLHNCELVNCNISFDGSCVNNMICNNLKINTTIAMYVGGDNVIE